MGNFANAPSAEAAAGKNPLEPFTLVIFGASGDLTRRKLIPAFYSLFCEGLLPDDFRVVGFARREKSDESFRAEMRRAVEEFGRTDPVDGRTWAQFAARLQYHRASFDDPDGFSSLRRRLEKIAGKDGVLANRLFYLATQPSYFAPIVDRLREEGLVGESADDMPWSRLIVEKPFGQDLQSARTLNRTIKSAFSENQIFRIDHYLGKETVQNILVFRFANSIFEPIWNQKYIDHVQITVSESIGVEGRGRYYEQSGALRDIVQNHMMHLLSLVGMEAPTVLEADAIRDEKVKVFGSLRRIPPDCAANGVIRAQYAAGESLGETVPAYRQEEGVAADSNTETYVAFKAFIDNWRWAGVPFYLRTGKRMPARLTEISIHFKPVPHVLFDLSPTGPMRPNVLALRIQPNEGISLRFQVKEPGMAMRIKSLRMDFGYSHAFGKEPPDAYERLLLDAALGDSTLFTRSDEVEAAWKFATPILEGCVLQPARELPTYAAGTWGPKEADDLIAADGRRWELLKRSARRAGAEPTRNINITFD